MAVKIYTTPTCSHCTTAKQYLKEQGVKFTEYNVARDERRADEMYKKSRQMGVPVIDVNGKILVGFSKGDLERALKR